VCLENKKLVVVLTLLLVVVSASASPTVTTGNIIVTATSDVADTPTAIIPGNLNIIAPANPELVIIGRDFLWPWDHSASATDNQLDNTKALPAVPATCFMVLTGFLCISLVRDRRVWLAALAALLWAGQAGVQAVPQLAMYVYRRAHTNKQFAAQIDRSGLLENTNRLRCDIEGTKFIGLLHYLEGIPHGTMSFLPRQGATMSFLRKQESSQTEHEFRTSQFAIARLLPHIICATNCPAVTVEQHIRFSPAFFFDNLARGPPVST
jgi:hypothetical protein